MKKIIVFLVLALSVMSVQAQYLYGTRYFVSTDKQDTIKLSYVNNKATWDYNKNIFEFNSAIIVDSIFLAPTGQWYKGITWGVISGTLSNQIDLKNKFDSKLDTGIVNQYASIYRHRSLGDTTQSIPTGTTPTKVLSFSTNGVYRVAVSDKNNDRLIINSTGVYDVTLSLSYASGGAGIQWIAYIFVNGVESQEIHSTGYAVNANDKRSTATSGQIRVTSVPCYIDYRVTHSSGSSVNLIITFCNLKVTKIGN